MRTFNVEHIIKKKDTWRSFIWKTVSQFLVSSRSEVFWGFVFKKAIEIPLVELNGLRKFELYGKS